jgi:hypothetical protein
MRRSSCSSHRDLVRVLLDIRRDGDGRVVGQVTGPGGAPERFSGWLELVHILEDHADGMVPEEQGSET